MRLTTLGTLTLETEDEIIRDLPARPRRAAILVYLAFERITTREKVLGVFWPERSPGKGRHALNQTLHVLRQDLGTRWLESHGDQLRVTDALELDAERFQEAVVDGKWEEAVERYSGRFLEGLYLVDTNQFESWVSSVQRRLEDQHYDACRRLVIERRRHDSEGALEAARSWVSSYPHMEEAQYECVRLLVASGRKDEALRQWEHFQERIEHENLSAPSDAWSALGAQLRQEPTAGELDLTDVDITSPRGGTEPWRGTPVRGPRLVRMVDGEEGESYRLRLGETVIGRDKGHLSFPEDALMSSPHAVIRVEEQVSNGGVTTGARYRTYRSTIRDDGSRNGVFVRIRQEWPLEDGDAFAIGQQLFRFRMPDPGPQPTH